MLIFASCDAVAGGANFLQVWQAEDGPVVITAYNVVTSQW